MLPSIPASSVISIDLGLPLPKPLVVPERGLYRVLIRFHGRPLGQVFVPAHENELPVDSLVRAIERQLLDRILQESVINGLSTPGQTSLDFTELLRLPAAPVSVPQNQLTAILCSTGTDELRVYSCLAALIANTVPPAEVVIVLWGQAGDTDRWRSLQQDWKADFPVRWLILPEADLATARQAAIEATTTPLLAFLDDSVRVDTGWVAAVVRAFEDYPHAAAVIGPVLPDSLQPEAARIRESILTRISWAEPLKHQWYRLRPDQTLPQTWFNTLHLGSGSNMSFRRSIFAEVGGFLPAGEGASRTHSQHLDLWLRILGARHGVVKDPSAFAWCPPATTVEEVHEEIHRTAAGISASLVAAAGRMPRRTPGLLMMALWFIRTSLGDIVRNRGELRSVSRTRLRGHLRGTWEGVVAAWKRRNGQSPAKSANRANRTESCGVAAGRVTPIELSIATNGAPTSEQLQILKMGSKTEFGEYLAFWHGQLLGQATSIVSAGLPVTLRQIVRGVVENSWYGIQTRHLGLIDHSLEFEGFVDQFRSQVALARATTLLHRHLLPSPPDSAPHLSCQPLLPLHDSVSIVIPTCDRPGDLGECLAALHRQGFHRDVEIIVVDNNPDSGLTAPVLSTFPKVRAITERRRGAAYARNRGLLESRGTIIVSIDDDVIVPGGWLEGMLKPFANPLVGVVTGNVIPHRMQTPEERLSESCCSLSAGPHPILVDGDWFWSHPQPVQGWDFGATANVAIRADMLVNSDVGLLMESLGPGTPVGAGEDPYFFYRVVRAGYQLVYLPDVWVWHKHRATKASLRRQVYNYAKSAVAYHLTTLFRDRDQRARMSLLGGLQKHYLKRFVSTLRGRSNLPLWLVLSELSGHIAGVIAFPRSLIREWWISRKSGLSQTPPRLPRRQPDANEPWFFSPNQVKNDEARHEKSPGPSREVSSASVTSPDQASLHSQGRLPHFLVIGAQKAGTTALNVNLKKHPLIELVPNFESHWANGDKNDKETHFFRGLGAEYGCPTLEVYRSLFNNNGLLQGEVCPTYNSQRALEKIASTIPDVKLILICREPVSRLESAYNHLKQLHAASNSFKGWQLWPADRDFDDNVRLELSRKNSHGLVHMGFYDETIETAWKLFRRDQLLILIAEEYRENPQTTYDRIFDFLGIPRVAIDHADAHVRSYTAKLSDDQRRQMAELYHPHNRRFFELIQREIPSWIKAEQKYLLADANAPAPVLETRPIESDGTTQAPSGNRPQADSNLPPPGSLTPQNPGRYPHFLVIGAQKSGTTAIHYNLKKHPQIEMLPNFRSTWRKGNVNDKETHFFSGEGQRHGCATDAIYRSLFNNNDKLQGEACPGYDSEKALKRIAEAIPDCKLILLCREPVSRVESAYNHLSELAKTQGVKDWSYWDFNRSFEENLRHELRAPDDFGFLRMGLYHHTIDTILKHFRREQLLVLIAEEYRENPQSIYDQVFGFLGVQPMVVTHNDVHVREHTTRLSPDQRQWLADFYRPHNQKLFEFLQREVPAWMKWRD